MLVSAAACMLSALSPVQGALCVATGAKLVAADGDAGDLMGESASILGNTALIGAPDVDDFGNFSGAAYVFVRSGDSWQQQVKLYADAPDPSDLFGTSVALADDIAFVGSTGDDDAGEQAGAVFAFVRAGTSWSLAQKLLVASAAPGDRFGSAVAAEGSTLVAGARQAQIGGAGLNPGAAYVFERQGQVWVQTARLLAPDGQDGDVFGQSVAISGGSILVGARKADGGAPESGGAYVFRRDGAAWVFEDKLIAPDGAVSDDFGYACSLRGDVAAIGAWGAGAGGKAYVFHRSAGAWTCVETLVGASTAPFDSFGWDLALGDDALMVGAFGADGSGSSSGAAHLFLRHGDSWSEALQLTAHDAAAGDAFGRALAADLDTFLVTATGDDPMGLSSGSAYAVRLARPSGVTYCTCALGPCGNHDPDAGCGGSTGTGAALLARGGTLPDQVELVGLGLPTSQPCVLVEGSGVAGAPFGDGLLCLGGSLVQVHMPPTSTSPAGGFAYGRCVGDLPLSAVTGVQPGSGETRRYQLWYRDPAGPCGAGFNASNGFEIVW